MRRSHSRQVETAVTAQKGDSKRDAGLLSLLVHELQNEAGDFVVSLIQREMTSVEQVDFCLWDVTLKASAPAAMNEGSFRPQTTRVGGLCALCRHDTIPQLSCETRLQLRPAPGIVDHHHHRWL
jgi:hypothetical protein